MYLLVALFFRVFSQEFLSTVQRALATIKQHKIFAGIEEKAPLVIDASKGAKSGYKDWSSVSTNCKSVLFRALSAHNLSIAAIVTKLTQDAFCPAKYKAALMATRTYEAGANLFHCKDLYSSAPGVPYNRAGINALMQHTWKTPQPFPHVLVVAVPDDAYDPYEHKGGWKCVSPEELRFSFYLAIARDIESGVDKVRMTPLSPRVAWDLNRDLNCFDWVGVSCSMFVSGTASQVGVVDSQGCVGGMVACGLDGDNEVRDLVEQLGSILAQLSIARASGAHLSRRSRTHALDSATDQTSCEFKIHLQARSLMLAVGQGHDLCSCGENSEATGP